MAIAIDFLIIMDPQKPKYLKTGSFTNHIFNKWICQPRDGGQKMPRICLSSLWMIQMNVNFYVMKKKVCFFTNSADEVNKINSTPLNLFRLLTYFSTTFHFVEYEWEKFIQYILNCNNFQVPLSQKKGQKAVGVVKTFAVLTNLFNLSSSAPRLDIYLFLCACKLPWLSFAQT